MRRFALLLSLLVALALPASPAHAVEPDEILADPALEVRARELSTGLRCLVCQNQSIDDSNAPLARDLRLLIRERLKEGDTDKQVLDYLVARYGEFVLLKPRFEPHTYALWLATPLVFLLALGVIWSAHRRRQRLSAGNAPEPLTAAERRRLKRLTD